MADGLQAAGSAAFQKLPYGMQRIGMPKILPANGQGSSGMRAGVEDGNPVSPVFVKDEADFTNPDYAPQFLRHEQTHRQTANWPAPLQKMLPPINPSDPYNYGGVAGLQKLNSNPLKLSQEQMAAAEQKIQAMEQNGEPIPAPLKKLDQNFQAVPLSVMQPTDPHGKGINTMPRSPGLPAGYDPTSGKILQTQDVLPVKPGSGQDLPAGWSATAPTTEDSELPPGWNAKPPDTRQPAAPLDTRNGLQKAVDEASAPYSPQERSLQSPMQNAISDFEKGALRTTVQPLVHPIQTLKGIGQTAAETSGLDAMEGKSGPIAATASTLHHRLKTEPLSQSIPETAGEVGGIAAGSALGGEAADAAKPTIARIGEGMKSSAGRIVDQTAGLRKADVSHGAQPGRAYLEGGGGPVLTMRGLANKAGKIADDAGERLGQHYSDATASGVKIPAMKVAETLNAPISKAFDIQEGPGGTGNTGGLEDYSASLRPLLKQGAQQGGISPSELFNAKRNISANTIWNDPTQFNLNKVRQMNTGGMSGLLGDAVPEVRPLNKIYQGTTNLAKRAGMRADTGQSPLTEISRKGLEAALGGGIGFATHHPILGALPLLADTVPARTAGASALFAGGRALPGATGALGRLLPPAAATRGIQRIDEVEPDKKNNK